MTLTTRRHPSLNTFSFSIGRAIYGGIVTVLFGASTTSLCDCFFLFKAFQHTGDWSSNKSSRKHSTATAASSTSSSTTSANRRHFDRMSRTVRSTHRPLRGMTTGHRCNHYSRWPRLQVMKLDPC